MKKKSEKSASFASLSADKPQVAVAIKKQAQNPQLDPIAKANAQKREDDINLMHRLMEQYYSPVLKKTANSRSRKMLVREIESFEETICVNCGSENIHQHGYEQMRYKCIECNKTFFAGPAPIANKYYEIKIAQLILEGLTTSQIVSILRVSRKTVAGVYIKHQDFFDEIVNNDVKVKRGIPQLKNLSNKEGLKKERIRLDDISKRIFIEDDRFRTSGLIIARHKHARFEVHTDDKLLTIFIVERNDRQPKKK